jgi:hypothetical protein
MASAHFLRASVLFSCCVLAGCKPSAPPAVTAAPLALRQPVFTTKRSSTRPGIQTDPRYQEAARLYASGNRNGAAAVIDKLLSSTAISEPDRTFLERQKALCAVALTPSPSPNSGRGERLPLIPTSSAVVPTTLAVVPTTLAVIPSETRNPPAPAHNAATIPLLQDCGPRALQIICKRLGKDADLDRLRKECGTTEKVEDLYRGASLDGLARAARSRGLKAEGIQVNREALNALKTPAIAWVSGNHYVAVLKVEDGRATIIDPNQGREEVIETEELLRRSGGILLTLSR